MYYLRIEKDNSFGFIVSGIHTILTTDIPISNIDYNKFFELQSLGKQFRIKNPKGTTLFEILEEYTPVIEDISVIPSLDEKVEIIEQDLADLMMELATVKLGVE